ncbi:MAG TPA: hypothetical protein ENL08_01080, partial [Bacteroidetes bacterium]|nr:hypothetical protein [Bacteroidota bacterium]
WEIRRRPPFEPVEVDRLLGAAMMMRRRALEDTGGFDERFFLFSEEEDICLRLKQAGWRIYYHPGPQIVHRGAASTDQNLPMAVAAADWSRYLFMKKHHSRLSAEVSRFIWIAAVFLRLLLVHLMSPLKGMPRAEGYLLSLRSLLKPGYFERAVRPQRRNDLQTRVVD